MLKAQAQKNSDLLNELEDWRRKARGLELMKEDYIERTENDKIQINELRARSDKWKDMCEILKEDNAKLREEVKSWKEKTFAWRNRRQAENKAIGVRYETAFNNLREKCEEAERQKGLAKEVKQLKQRIKELVESKTNMVLSIKNKNESMRLLTADVARLKKCLEECVETTKGSDAKTQAFAMVESWRDKAYHWKRKYNDLQRKLQFRTVPSPKSINH